MDQFPPHQAFRHKNVINNFSRFDIDDNKLDLGAKVSALEVGKSVVCLKSYSGNEQLFICCGIYMECESRFGTSIGTILTSATLLRSPDGAAKLASDLKIDVYTVGGKSFEGKVVAVDFHYNIATIEIRPDSALPIPNVRLVDNVVEVGLHCTYNQDSASTSDRVKLRRGVKVLALARYFKEPYDIMVVSGEVRFGGGQFDFDCNELLKASCKIKKNGIGGPLINLHGEVIGINFYGINFYEGSYTPFLPMNIVIKCFEDLKRNGCISRPSLGVVVRDLYSTSFHNLESMCSKFPHVVKGAIINEVLLDSAAHRAGLCADDVIINCGGACVGGSLELTELLWGKEGKPIELVVVRASIGEQLKIFVDALDANPTENRWPVPELRIVRNIPCDKSCFW